MKKVILNVLVALCLALVSVSCSEDNLIGSSIQPGQDVVNVYYDTMSVVSETVFQDSLRLRSSGALLGKITTPDFGILKSDFLSELYCPYNFEFPEGFKQIDSIHLYLYYDSFYGDSNAVMNVNVWQLDKAKLSSAPTYHASINPLDYCSMTKKLGHLAYTTADYATSDTLKQNSDYQKVLRIPLSMALADSFYSHNRSHPEYFSTPEAFKDYFKGIYITTDFGDGSLIYISLAELEISYKTYISTAWTDNENMDSLVVQAAYFPVTKEIRQVNRVENQDLKNKLNVQPTDSLNYIYAPAGMFTKVRISSDLFNANNGKLKDATINTFKLYVEAADIEENFDFAFDKPTELLLIDSSKVTDFFNGFNLNDGKSSFIAEYDATENRYIFNMSYYAQKMIRYNKGVTIGFTPFSTMMLIPVNKVKNVSENVIRLEHMITPATVKIRSGVHASNPMQLRMVYTKE